MPVRLSSGRVNLRAACPSLTAAQSRLLRCLIATALLLAAVSKIRSQSAGSGSSLDFAIAGWELILGGWLLYGWQPVWSLTTGLFSFSAFVGALLQRLLLGRPECDCFGDLEVAPQWTLMVDVGMLFVLVWMLKSSSRTVSIPSLIALMLLGCAAGVVMDTARLAVAPSRPSIASTLGRSSPPSGIDDLPGAEDAFIVEAMRAMLTPEISALEEFASLDTHPHATLPVGRWLSSPAFRTVSAWDLSSDFAAASGIDGVASTELAWRSPVGILMHHDKRRWVVAGVTQKDGHTMLEVMRNEHTLYAIELSKLKLGESTSLRVPAPHRGALARRVHGSVTALSFDRLWCYCGNIGNAAAADVRFQMRNESARPVTISRLAPSCGCLHFTALEGKSLQPGEATTLDVTVARGAGNAFSHSLRLELRGDFPEAVRLRIFGRQDRGMTVTPSLVDFGAVRQAAPSAARLIRLTESSSDRFQVVRVQLPEMLQQQGVLEQTLSLDGLRSYLVRLTVKPDCVGEGRNEGMIKIETTSQVRPTVAIPFRLFGQPSRGQSSRGQSSRGQPAGIPRAASEGLLQLDRNTHRSVPYPCPLQSVLGLYLSSFQ